MPKSPPKAALIIATKPEGEHKIIVPAPPGLDMEGKSAGDTLDAVCEFEIEPDGKNLCLKNINGIAMEGYDKEEGEQEAPPDNSFAGMVTGQPEGEA